MNVLSNLYTMGSSNDPTVGEKSSSTFVLELPTLVLSQ